MKNKKVLLFKENNSFKKKNIKNFNYEKKIININL